LTGRLRAGEVNRVGQLGSPVSELTIDSWILISYGGGERWVQVTGVVEPGRNLPGGPVRSGDDKWVVSVATDGRAWSLRLDGADEYPTVRSLQ
jgi:hypothetical protein